MLNLKQLFCSHKFELKGRRNYTFKYVDETISDVPVSFYECCKCHKRTVVRESKYFYRDTTLEILKLWQKHEIEIADID